MTVQIIRSADPVDLSAMADKWPSAIVARKAISQFTGGLLATGTMRNQDKDIPKIYRNKQVFYRVDDLVAWISSGCEVDTYEPKKTPDELLEEKFERERAAKKKRKTK